MLCRCQFKTSPLWQSLPDSWHQLMGSRTTDSLQYGALMRLKYVEHLTALRRKTSVTEDWWMEVFTTLRAWIILTSPPFTQSSSHPNPPDSESQENSSADDLQIYGTVLCHVIRSWFNYLNLTWNEKGFDASPRSGPRLICQTLTSNWVAVRRRLYTARESHERVSKLHFAFRKSWLGCEIELLKSKNLGSPRFPLSHNHPVV